MDRLGLDGYSAYGTPKDKVSIIITNSEWECDKNSMTKNYKTEIQ